MWTPKRWIQAWRNRERATPYGHSPRADLKTVEPRGRVMSGTYLLLYKYLDERYADTVVLTFAQIEDVLGFALPEQARQQKEWWTDPETNAVVPNYSDSWVLASRTATPNLLARTVAFDRAV